MEDLFARLSVVGEEEETQIELDEAVYEWRDGRLFDKVQQRFARICLVPLIKPATTLLFDSTTLEHEFELPISLNELHRQSSQKQHQCLKYSTSKSLDVWKTPMAKKLAESHFNHCLGTSTSTSCRKLLVEHSFVQPEDEPTLVLLMKLFQRSWTDMCLTSTTCCCCSQPLDEKTASVDLVWQRTWIVETLLRARYVGVLHTIRAGNVVRMFADPAFGNLRLIHADENIHRGRLTDTIYQNILSQLQAGKQNK